MSSFFEKNYQTPDWLTQKLSRRNVLKSAAGATAIAAMPKTLFAAQSGSLNDVVKKDPWQTLDAVLNQLLPASETGPSAQEIRATLYLYNVVNEQPTEQAEIDFIYKGVGWLNDFSQSQLKKAFVDVSFDEKEQLLKAIIKSTAGENWLNNLLGYVFEAMLSPPSYGGNPDGIGWRWLDHKAGFPLPEKGKRYFEIPGHQRIAVNQNAMSVKVPAKRAGSKKS